MKGIRLMDLSEIENNEWRDRFINLWTFNRKEKLTEKEC